MNVLELSNACPVASTSTFTLLCVDRADSSPVGLSGVISSNPFSQVYLSLLRMYLSTPDAHCLGPIKLQLSEPQANLQAALRVLKLHHSKLNTTKVSVCSAP